MSLTRIGMTRFKIRGGECWASSGRSQWLTGRATCFASRNMVLPAVARMCSQLRGWVMVCSSTPATSWSAASCVTGSRTTAQQKAHRESTRSHHSAHGGPNIAPHTGKGLDVHSIPNKMAATGCSVGTQLQSRDRDLRIWQYKLVTMKAGRCQNMCPGRAKPAPAYLGAPPGAPWQPSWGHPPWHPRPPWLCPP